MSRSYKRTPVFKDGSDNSKTKKYSKRLANKKVRRQMIEQRKKSNDYRKNGMESWDICDYRFYRPKSINMTEEELYTWKKYFYRK